MSAAQPETGIPFGKYRLIRRLAVGGMAEIWLATTMDSAAKPLVLKRILPQFASDPEFVARFREEASLTLSLVHGNIVPVFEIGAVGGEPYIALEHVPGHDLRAVLKRMREKGATAPPGVAAYLAAELLRGLDYAHRKTDARGRPLFLVHRDVSPSNVVVSREGTVKLLDFGIAKAIGRAEATRTGVLRGKVGYMSPEQARGDAVGPASDLFSTGVVLWELLTAQRLFEGDSEPAVLERVKSAAVPPVRERNPQVPEALVRILDRALARETSARAPDARTLLAELNGFLATCGLPADAEAVSAFLRELFPEDHGAEEEADARTATHAPAGAAASPVALQLGGGLVASTPSAIVPPGSAPTGSAGATRWTLLGAGLAGAAAAGALTLGLGRVGAGPGAGAAAPGTGALYVNSVPSGAAVRIDGDDTGRTTPDEFGGLAAGPHEVEVTLADHAPWSERAVVEGGDTVIVTAKLLADVRTLRVETDPPGASVAIPAIGAGPCNAPCSFPQLKPSQTVEVVARHPGHRESRVRVRVADQAGALRIALTPDAPPAGGVRARTPPPEPAATPVRVSFRILPYGTFRVGGRSYENAARDVGLDPGRHEVAVTNAPLGVDALCSVEIGDAAAGTVLKIDVTDGVLPKNCRRRRP